MFPAGFETRRLRLRPIAMADAPPIFDGYTQDPRASRYVTWRPHMVLADTEAYVARSMAALLSRTYVLVRKADDRLVGAFDLRDTGPGRRGYGYVLAPSCWGQGLMTEALTEVADWCLRQSDIFRIGDVCDVENIGSARVMEKAGLTREGRLRRWGIHPNLGDEPRDCFVYAKVR